MQDLVEELSRAKTWYTPRKLSQQAYERNEDGSFKGYEEEVYHACLLARNAHGMHSVVVVSMMQWHMCGLNHRALLISYVDGFCDYKQDGTMLYGTMLFCLISISQT